MNLENNSDTIYFAKTDFRGAERIFGIRNSDRRQHFYIIGKSGTGKTSLLANMALQDIQNGKGIAIVDPHGDFVEEIARRIPEERANDVIYFNPADMDYPIGFNVLEVPDPKYKHLIASDLMGIFTKIWANVWSARMEYILSNCVLALLDTQGTTLLGIPRILVDQNYRQKIIENIKDPVVKAFWVHEYESWRDQFRNEAIVPIQNKVGQFLSTSLIRNIVGQKKSALNVGDVINNGKILLVNVSKGRVGEDNANLLGAMIITKIQLAAMERVRIPEDERKDFYLYVDEFQNFATDSFASILSEARKYRLNLILAHQYIGQLVVGASTKVRDAIFGNVGTEIVFRVGAADAEFLEKEFQPEFMMQDLVNIPNYHIYLKLMVEGVTSRPFSAITLPPLSLAQKETDMGEIIENSRKLYGSNREEVEEQIKKWSESSGEFADEEVIKTDLARNQAICWICEKETEVKFKPEKGKPVYCQNCLKKIEKGEITPIHLPRFEKKKINKYESTLGKLGIEFEDGPQKDFYENKGLEKSDFKNKDIKPKDSFLDFKKGDFVLKEPLKEENREKHVSLSRLSQNLAKRENILKKNFVLKNNVFRPPVKKNEPKNSKELAELKNVLKEVLDKENKENAVFKKENEPAKPEKFYAVKTEEVKQKLEQNSEIKSIEKELSVDVFKPLTEIKSVKESFSENVKPEEQKREEKFEKKLEEKKGRLLYREQNNFKPAPEKKKEIEKETEKEKIKKIIPGDTVKF